MPQRHAVNATQSMCQCLSWKHPLHAVFVELHAMVSSAQLKKAAPAIARVTLHSAFSVLHVSMQEQPCGWTSMLPEVQLTSQCTPRRWLRSAPGWSCSCGLPRGPQQGWAPPGSASCQVSGPTMLLHTVLQLLTEEGLLPCLALLGTS